MKTKTLVRIGICLLIVSAILLLRKTMGTSFSVDHVLEIKAKLTEKWAENPSLATFLLFGIYVASTALALPVATVLTLIAGSFLGLIKGTLLVSFASTLGACFSLLISRFLFRDFFKARFERRIKDVLKMFESNSIVSLLSLRLLPIAPFFLINIASGLTQISVFRFWWVSQIGMLPATLVYVNAGVHLGELEPGKPILTAGLVASLFLLAVFPWIANGILNLIKTRLVYSNFKRPSRFDANVVVIGAGAAGLVAASTAANVKAKVILVENNEMGGDCLNTGCVPSKSFIKSSRIIRHIQNAKRFGLDSASAQFDFTRIQARIAERIERVRPHDSIERYTAMGVECIKGRATIRSPFEVEVNGRSITTQKIVIATGASPIVPTVPGLEFIDKNHVHTSETIWNLKKRPNHLLIVGGGPIGCELAQAFSAVGTKVTIVERANRLLFKEHVDASSAISSQFEKDGITAHLSTEIVSFFKIGTEQSPTFGKFSGQNESLRLEYKALISTNDRQQEIPFDNVLFAMGRTPNTKDIGLESLDIQVSSNGRIAVDEMLFTKYPNISAIGDVSSQIALTSISGAQGWYAIVNLLFGSFKKFKFNYSLYPRVVFTEPEIASIGLNADECKNQGIPFEVTRYEMSELDRAITESEESGFIEILTEQNSDRILGTTIVSQHASELIGLISYAMKQKHGLRKIMTWNLPYPTWNESIRSAAFEWQKSRKPEKLLHYLARFWGRNIK